MVSEALKRVEELYLESLRKEKETYDELTKAQVVHRLARDSAILTLRALNNAMNAEQRERTLELEKES